MSLGGDVRPATASERGESLAAKLRAFGGPRGRRFGAGAALSAWFVVLLAIGSSLLARHVLALPLPSAEGPMTAGLAALAKSDARGPLGADDWTALHVLYAECRCSERVLDHLVTTARPAHLRETVLLVGDDAEGVAKLRAQGIRVESVTPNDLATTYGVEAVPLLVLADPRGHVRYLGGYTETKQALVVHDASMLTELRAGRAVASLPVFGCAVSAELRSSVNPLGVP